MDRTSLPDFASVNLEAFTLFSCHLKRHLPSLEVALQGDTRWTTASCLSRFNKWMNELFESRSDNLEEATYFLCNVVEVGAQVFKRSNAKVVKVFEDIIEGVKAESPSWGVETHIEAYHQQGRSLARQFYRDTPWTETLNKLEQEAELVCEYGISGTNNRSDGKLDLGYRAAPMATFHNQGESPEQSRIVLRFSYDNDFALYLLYPFLFLHEYTGHIYANDFKNTQFNDGWMLYAANSFLVREWNSTNSYDFSFEQVNIFEEVFYEKLSDNARKGYTFSKRFDDWLDSSARGLSFAAITFELAAFRPEAGEKNFWPSEFINALKRDFTADRSALAAKIQAADSIRSLYSTLTHS